MSSIPTRRYRGVDADARRAERNARLREAALTLVGEGGVETVTVDAVCAQASLTKRYFYESFTDRDALLVTVLEDVLDDVRAAIGASVQACADDPAARIRATVLALVDTLSADPARARLYAEAPVRQALHDRRRAAQGEFADLVLETVLRAGPERRLEAVFVVAGATDVVARWLLGDLDVDHDELVARVSAIGLALV